MSAHPNTFIMHTINSSLFTAFRGLHRFQFKSFLCFANFPKEVLDVEKVYDFLAIQWVKKATIIQDFFLDVLRFPYPLTAPGSPRMRDTEIVSFNIRFS